MSTPKPNFSGTWRFNPGKSSVQIAAPDSTVFVIDHREPVLLLSRTHTVEEKQDAFSLELTTDGQPVTADRDGVHLTAQAYWEADALVFDTTLKRGEEEGSNLVKYRHSETGESFEANESFRSPSLNYDNLWVLDRVCED
jgi:hypothetical protein